MAIQKSWSLSAFTESHGKKIKISHFESPDGESWNSCFLTAPDGGQTRVQFSSEWEGPQTLAEIKSRKDKLQVVQIESGSFIMCKAGTVGTTVEEGEL